MKIKDGFKLHEVCGEHVIVATGEENIGFSKIIALNEAAACAWKAVCGKEFSVADMAQAITDSLDIDEATATADCEELLTAWNEAGLIA